MAASVISLSLDPQNSSAPGPSRPRGREEREEGQGFVLPSEVDCLGRPLARVAFGARLRRSLSLGVLRAYLGRLRQPAL